jgi:hypothetical protein
MAEISTCSYSAFRPQFGTPVRITLGGPRRPEPTGREHWLYLAELAPKGRYFKAPPDVFAREYLAQIERLAQDIEDKLDFLTTANGPVVLLCWERRIRSIPGDCHRRLFASFWEARTGQPVPELDARK